MQARRVFPRPRGPHGRTQRGHGTPKDHGWARQLCHSNVCTVRGPVFLLPRIPGSSILALMQEVKKTEPPAVQQLTRPSEAGPGGAPGGGWLASGAVGLMVVLLCVLSLAWLWSRWLNRDLWYDEVFTLDHYVFTHLRTTLTDYSYPPTTTSSSTC